MLGRDELGEESGLLECNGGNGRIIGQVIPLAHRLVLNEWSVGLEETGMVTLH